MLTAALLLMVKQTRTMPGFWACFMCWWARARTCAPSAEPFGLFEGPCMTQTFPSYPSVMRSDKKHTSTLKHFRKQVKALQSSARCDELVDTCLYCCHVMWYEIYTTHLKGWLKKRGLFFSSLFFLDVLKTVTWECWNWCSQAQPKLHVKLDAISAAPGQKHLDCPLVAAKIE